MTTSDPCWPSKAEVAKEEAPPPEPTSTAPDGVHVHVGVKLPGAQGLAGGHVSSDPLWGGAIGAHGGARGQAVLRFLFFLIGRLLRVVFSFRAADVMDTEQEAVVHDLQLDQKLEDETEEPLFQLKR